jgi:hypothetical protein
VSKGELPFVRSFARPFVCRRGVKKNDNAKKSDDEGKKERK